MRSALVILGIMMLAMVGLIVGEWQGGVHAAYVFGLAVGTVATSLTVLVTQR